MHPPVTAVLRPSFFAARASGSPPTPRASPPGYAGRRAWRSAASRRGASRNSPSIAPPTRGPRLRLTRQKMRAADPWQASYIVRDGDEAAAESRMTYESPFTHARSPHPSGRKKIRYRYRNINGWARPFPRTGCAPRAAKVVSRDNGTRSRPPTGAYHARCHPWRRLGRTLQTQSKDLLFRSQIRHGPSSGMDKVRRSNSIHGMYRCDS